MQFVPGNLDVFQDVIHAPRGWLASTLCCSLSDSVFWACLWTGCDRKQLVCWSDENGNVEQSDEKISASPPSSSS